MWPTATLSIGAATHIAVGIYSDDPLALQVGLSRAFVEYGIKEWSFVNDKGVPIPVDPKDPNWSRTVETLLSFTEGGNAVAEMGNNLYATDVLSPLMKRPPKPSAAGPITRLTSVTRTTGPAARKRSKRSSPATLVDGKQSEVQAQ